MTPRKPDPSKPPRQPTGRALDMTKRRWFLSFKVHNRSDAEALAYKLIERAGIGAFDIRFVWERDRLTLRMPRSVALEVVTRLWVLATSEDDDLAVWPDGTKTGDASLAPEPDAVEVRKRSDKVIASRGRRNLEEGTDDDE